MKKSAIRRMEFHHSWFEIVRNANIMNWLHHKLRGTIIKNWLYVVFPVFFFAGNIYLMIDNDVFTYSRNNDFITLSFLGDISNSICLPVIYFLSCFLSWYLPEKVNIWYEISVKEEVRKQVAEVKNEKGKNKVLVFECLILIATIGCGFVFGYIFYDVAMSNSGIWSYHLSAFAKIYYMIFLGVTWQQSLSVLFMALSGGFMIFWCVRENFLVYCDNVFNTNISIIKSADILITILSYGFFYIVGAVLFVINDKIVAQEPIKVVNVFADDKAALILICGVLMLVLLFCIPFWELYHFMEQKRDERLYLYDKRIKEMEFNKDTFFLKQKKQLLEERAQLIQKSLIPTSFVAKVMMILSIGVPVFGVILQSIQLYFSK